jgi:hypothetical protein
MSSSRSHADALAQANLLGPFLDHPDLPLPGLLTHDHVQQSFARHGVAFGTAANALFTPVLTRWAWLSQVVFPDQSTTAACVRVSVLLLALGGRPWSQDPRSRRVRLRVKSS